MKQVSYSHFILVHFWLHQSLLGFLHWLSLAVVSRSHSSWQYMGFPLRQPLCCRAQAPGVRASVAAAHRLVGPTAWVQQLWRTGLVVLRHIESSRIRDWNPVPCIGRQVPIHGSARRPGANSLPRAPLQILLLLLTPGRVGGPALAALCSHSVPSRKLECWPQTLAVMENTSGNILVRMFGYTHIHVSAEVEHAMFASRR